MDREMVEVQVSALLDGELSRSETLQVIDVLIDDPEVRDFYRGCRRLDRELDSVREGGAALPDGMWERIRSAAGSSDDPSEPSPAPERPVLRRRPARWWLVRAAAVVLAAVGIGVLSVTSPWSPEGAETMVIRIDGGPDRMTDERFLSLAGELLRSDSRYRETMEELLQAAERGGGASVEGTPDLRRAVSEDLRSDLVTGPDDPVDGAPRLERTVY